MSVIVAEGLSKQFSVRHKEGRGLRRILGGFRSRVESVSAVDSIFLSVEPGELVAFLGPNGAGKSTTIKMLTGILHPTSGTASILGLSPWKNRQQLAFRIGSVFGQKSQLWMHLPPSDTFRLVMRIYELDIREATRWQNELVELFDLQDLMSVPTRKLSLGQRMRCEIAASLLHKPDVLFLDEPTIGLDPVAKSTIRKLIRRIHAERGVTVFLTSHDAGDVQEVCRRAVIINHGRIVFDDSVNALRRDFLTHKEIGIRVNGDFTTAPDLPGLTLVKNKGGGAKLKLDTRFTPVEGVVAALMQKYEIEDITIENLPLEDVIARIYQSRGVDEHGA